MRRRFAVWAVMTGALPFATLSAIAIEACSSSDPTPPGSVLPGVDAAKTPRDAGSLEDVPDDGTPPPPPPPRSGRVYAHTADTLYLFEPFSATLTRIGKFDCIDPGNDAVLDIALDRAGAMYATTYYAFLSVNPTNAKCTMIGAPHAMSGELPNSLSFVPVGTVDATKEALVGYTFGGMYADRYVRIDTATGQITQLGMLNPTSPLGGISYQVSGDFVSLLRDGNRTLITVRAQGSDPAVTPDDLAEIDPKTGTLKKLVGMTGQSNVFGLGYWAGRAYGFSLDGVVTEIDVTTGKSRPVLALANDGGAPGADGWFGAGVTTDSPITP